MTVAPLMSHCLASISVPAAGADLFTESQLQLPAGTDPCSCLSGRASRLVWAAWALLGGPNVCQAVGAAQCDVKTLFPPIWYLNEEVFQLGAQRIEQEVEGVTCVTQGPRWHLHTGQRKGV